MKIFTKASLEWLFHYDRENGLLIWKNHWTVSGTSRLKGRLAGAVYKSTSGITYRQISSKFGSIPVHRIIYFLETGSWPENIDHIDGNGLNNCFSNLRAANHRMNLSNLECHRQGHLVGTTYLKNKKKWLSQITINYKRYHLGFFDNAEDAHQAYLTARSNLTSQEIKVVTYENAHIQRKFKRGTSFHSRSGKWRARTKINGKEKCLGYFDTEEQAHQKYLITQKELGRVQTVPV